jgi:hypothetical protein
MIKIDLVLLRDPQAVKKALLMDNMYQQILPCTDMESWLPNLTACDFFFIFRNEAPLGVLLIEKLCSNGLVYHGGVLKEERHKQSKETLLEVFKEMKRIYGPKVITTQILTTNEPAIKLAKKVGLVERCVIPNASLKGDIMILSE